MSEEILYVFTRNDQKINLVLESYSQYISLLYLKCDDQIFDSDDFVVRDKNNGIISTFQNKYPLFHLDKYTISLGQSTIVLTYTMGFKVCLKE